MGISTLCLNLSFWKECSKIADKQFFATFGTVVVINSVRLELVNSKRRIDHSVRYRGGVSAPLFYYIYYVF